MKPSINLAIAEIKRVAYDNKHGYSQKHRNGNPDYDCSSLVIHALDFAGFPMSKSGATYTGNMINALRKCGFVNIINKINLKTGKGMQAGDIFLNSKYHTAMAVSATKLCAARDNYDGKSGDSGGNEIEVYQYRNYTASKGGWTSVWRYKDKATNNEWRIAQNTIMGYYGNGEARIEEYKKMGVSASDIQTLVNQILTYKEVVKDVLNGKYGNGNERKKKLEKAGYPYKIVQNIVNAVMLGDITL